MTRHSTTSVKAAVFPAGASARERCSLESFSCCAHNGLVNSRLRSLKNFVLTGYGLPHAMGYLAVKDGTNCAKPVTPLELMEFASGQGLGGIEVPLDARDSAGVEALATPPLPAACA